MINNRYLLLLIFMLFLPACSVQQHALNPELIQQRWLAWHQQWAGTPHQLGGVNKQGIDCSAYVQRGYKELFSIELPRQTRQQVKTGYAVSRRNLRTGDLIFFKPNFLSNHVGVYMGDGTFLHVSSSRGVTRSSLRNNYWKDKYWKARRVRH